MEIRFTPTVKEQYAYNELITVLTLMLVIPPAVLLWMKYAHLIPGKVFEVQVDNLITGMLCLPVVGAIMFGILKGATMYIVHGCAVLASRRMWKQHHKRLTVKYTKRLAFVAVETQHDQTFETEAKTKRQV